MTEINTAGAGEMPWDEIARYVSDQMTADAREAFEHGLASDPVLRATTERVRDAMGAWGPVTDEATLETAREQMWAKMRERGMRQGRDYIPGVPGIRREVGWLGRQTLRKRAGIGAVMALLIGVLFFAHRAPPMQSDVTRVYATAAQQQAIVNLDDGTRVTLAPKTTLRIQHFGTQSRTVLLDSGEAYFEVAHASGAPFIVRSGAAVTQVLGTAFLIRHSAGNPHVRVAVIDGKVRVSSPARAGTGITLTTGQAGDVTDSTAQVSTTDDVAPRMERLPGRVVFHHTSFATVLQAVSQWYGYHFRYADSTLGTRSVTIMVSMRSSAEALAAIEQILSVNLTVVGDTITLVPQPPPSEHNTPRIHTYDIWTPTREVGR